MIPSQNGGKFDFIIESEASLPVDPDFWDFLLSSSKDSWNLLVYEQDWLYVTVDRLNALKVRYVYMYVLVLQLWLSNIDIFGVSFLVVSPHSVQAGLIETATL